MIEYKKVENGTIVETSVTGIWRCSRTFRLLILPGSHHDDFDRTGESFGDYDVVVPGPCVIWIEPSNIKEKLYVPRQEPALETVPD